MLKGGGWSLVEFDWLKRVKFGGFVELSWWFDSTMAAGVPLKGTALHRLSGERSVWPFWFT